MLCLHGKMKKKMLSFVVANNLLLKLSEAEKDKKSDGNK
jgi:hypothetical protein